MGNSFLRQNLVVLVLLNSSNAANYLFQIILGRSLSPAEYGAFNSMASLAVLYGGLVLVLNLVLSRQTALFSVESPGRVNTLLRTALVAVCGVSAAVLAAGLLGMPLLSGLLKVDSRLALILLAAHMALIPLVQIPLGVLQGLSRFTAYGLCAASTGGVYCLAGLGLVAVLGLGASGALGAYVLGSLVSTSLGLYLLRDVLRPSGVALPRGFLSGVGRYTLGLVAATAMVQALGNLDMLLARSYCSPEESGLYATAAVIGRIGFYLPLVLTSVLFPEVAKAKAEGRDDTRVLLTSLGLTGLLSMGFAGICLVASESVIVLLYGREYAAGAGLLRVVAPAMALLSVTNVLFTHFMARSDFRFLWVLLAGLAALLGLAWAFHSTPLAIARSLLAAVAFMAVGMAGLWFWWDAPGRLPGRRIG